MDKVKLTGRTLLYNYTSQILKMSFLKMSIVDVSVEILKPYEKKKEQE